jgi:diguanylate cyclase (GGDEF)-like protein
VLFADDDVAVRNAFARTLRAKGFLVDLARDGVEALAFAQEYPYAFVATDEHMPGLSGTALISQLKRLQPHSKFVIVTGHPDVKLRVAQDPTAPEVILKPWQDNTLVALVTKAVEEAKRRSMRAALPGENRSDTAPCDVLLVEDDDQDAATLTSALEQASEGTVRVVRATRLADACALLKSSQFSVVLSELILPDSHGLGALSELMAVAPATPVLVVAASDDEVEALRAVQTGAQDYLLKCNLGGAGVLRAVRYAIERKQSEARLIQLAHFDPLTRLANRTLLNERLSRALSRCGRSGKSVGLLFVDLDHFKSVNDTYGHDVGDELLKLVGSRLIASTRGPDTVARVGGDEFAILLEDVDDVDGARRVAQRIVNGFATPLVVRGTEQPVTCSIGVAMSPNHGVVSDTLLRATDRALYQAKDRGRNCYVVAGEEGADRISRRIELERELMSDLNEERISLALLPVMDIVQDKVLGHEVLMRWDSSDGSQLTAGELLPALGQVGELPRVGGWILEAVCALARKQMFVGTLSINISLQEFTHVSFVERVRDAIRKAGIAGGQIEFELSEATLTKNLVATRARLGELAAIGVRAIIDDYGAGRSSLVELAELPIAGVKLAPSVVQNLGRRGGPEGLAAVLAVSKTLGWSVVAKSVETDSQLDTLRLMGCPRAQGRLFGEPRKPDTIIPAKVALAS